MKKLLFLFAVIAFGPPVSAQKTIGISCIGDSIMFGNGLPSRERNNFPAQLQNMLGKGYAVTKDDDPDMLAAKLQNKLGKGHIVSVEKSSRVPDIAIICFADERRMDSAVLACKAKRIIIALPPVFPGGDLGDRERRMSAIRALAAERLCEIVDLAPVIAAKSENFQDAMHLSSLGATEIARRLYEAVQFRSAAPIDVVQRLGGQSLGSFYGFRKFDVSEGHQNITVISPVHPAKGYPWAQVSGDKTDSATLLGLLERGVHIVISANTIHGPRLQKAGLAPKPAISTNNTWTYDGTPLVHFGERPLPAVLRALHLQPNFAAIAAPGSEYRSGAGWFPGKDWWAQHGNIDSLLRAPGQLDVVFLGNSITQGTGGHRTTTTYKPGFAAFDSAFGMYRWESAGISGDRTQNVLWRLQNGAYRAAAPRLIVLTIGVNNFPDNGPEEVAAGIKAIVKWIGKHMPKTKLLLIGPLPAGNKPGDMRRIKYEKTHAIIQGLAVRGRYLPLGNIFILPDGSLDPELYSRDGIHLQPAGYQAWAKALKPVVDEMLR
ncbi:GDSL-type esterase/lipase family protein [Chitinophaga rhizosphaerae]|uniref:GDSL-type esterase/lipase family protein n=1 Tax=Chitinophaga rhizosphaerae TaxID=1864947 RepID=UPI000F7FDDE9|nr:GDSL-type esterase/lipase family protein [Chitinophaga rhizosphaerae]